ncbi:MAG: anaerobic ribonucleoside-triphosphate reductase activating protein [Puniceicoccales bacterium]|nr:anaerobic ribonucleoside-triphosphate reductase activating protein [Puniceicoccales bacterium]
MKIGGVQKISLIDFPGKIAAVVFTQGCNFRCQFCHNESLVLPEKFGLGTDMDEFFDFLGERKRKIDAVVVSGGEPTLHHDLDAFLCRVKDLGFLSKLDTNGTNPQILQNLFHKNLLDYVAMDIKHSFAKYGEIVGVEIDVERIKLSIDLIKNSGVDYEFRTTIVPQFHGQDDIKSIALQISGARRFALQKFVPDHAINKNLTGANSIFDPENEKILRDVVKFCESHVGEIILRN